MRGHGQKLTRKDEQAIAALLSFPTIGEAATAVGISESTLWRWLKNPVFAQAYREARAAAVSQSLARLQQVSSKAVDTLEDVMKDTEAPHAARVTAAKTVLEMAVKGTEIAELQRRLQALEQAQSEPEPPTEKEGQSIVIDLCINNGKLYAIQLSCGA
jgi:hypothetical protein